MLKLITAMTIALVAMPVAVAVAYAAPAKEDKVHVATCNDGKEYYNSTNDHRFACAGHKGVKAWSDGSPDRAKGSKGTREYR